ncbi:MAG: aspartate--tRNA ligase [Zestosphaera tikiterensis]|uniref:Aspartate--tRNA ligase n=1 Tax=Zestosphaera tikiterensis TaxID=1973259 RepID=A0A2R7YAZ5_9CREN|nr:MAG: aspartate--tRNA ligase [Zestosphaera tikiterensis]
MKRTHWCGELRREHVGLEVVVNGWVHALRKVGRIVFLVVRDRSGLVQAVVTPKNPNYSLVSELSLESVVAIKGVVRLRPPNQVNPEMPTGEIEIDVKEVQVLNPAKPLPLPIFDKELMKTTSETFRLKYRYLDLRRFEMLRNLTVRAKFITALREFFNANGFIEVETPYLARSTPEGARDFLVPSRLYPGKFYSLTQSPQLFKQLLMIAGFERYYQVARCFRDEDPRADRQPEFTQFDVEMSFVTAEDVMNIVEEAMRYAFKKVFNVDLENPFPKIKYREAMDKYGIDKPDLRFELFLETVTEHVRGLIPLREGDVARALRFNFSEELTKNVEGLIKEIIPSDGKVKYVYVLRGSNDVVTNEVGLAGDLIKVFNLGIGEGLVVTSGEYIKASEAIGNLRNSLGKLLGLADKNTYKFAWVVDFPLFELDEEGRLTSMHHPFTSPKLEEIPKLDTNPLEVTAQAYDLILNGYEVGGGSIRINKRELQEKILAILGLSKDEMLDRYGFLLEALEYGAPPHGGIALGLDRLVAIALGYDNIREVIAFPKTKEMTDPMTGAPSKPPEEYLREIKWIKVLTD